jgi:2-polyprenyl-6-methoxyphenol hydroxylase-like FAD-dependent oxidoreductase
MHPVLVAAGGPAVLLNGLLLARRGFIVLILEKAKELDKWSDQSYFTGINARGIALWIVPVCCKQ